MESREEKLSQLLDGELSPSDAERLLAEMAGDVALQAAWRRYHLAREALRGEPLTTAPADFAERVAQSVAAEATFEKRRASVGSRDTEAANGDWAELCRDWFGPMAGLALAASISALAVLGMRESGVEQLPPNMVDAGYATLGRPVALQQANNGLLSTEQLNEYLIMHNEGVYLSGSDGMLPQARVVSIGGP